MATSGERSRTTRPRTSKPLVGILGDVDGRIVPVAPRQSLNSWAKSQSHRTRHNQRIGIRNKQLLRFERGLVNQGCRVGDGLQAFDWDRLAGDFAKAVGSLFDA